MVRILIRVVFPAPFGPKQAEQLPGMDGEVDILQRDQRLGFALLRAAHLVDAAELAGFDGIVCGRHVTGLLKVEKRRLLT